MSHACTPTLVSVAILVSEILLLSKMAKFPFWTMGYSPWSSKNLINRNRLKKSMQVGMDVACMHTNFGGRGYIGFGDITTFKNVLNWLKKFMLVGVDVACRHTNFDGCGYIGFGDITTFKKGQISLLDHGL